MSVDIKNSSSPRPHIIAGDAELTFDDPSSQTYPLDHSMVGTCPCCGMSNDLYVLLDTVGVAMDIRLSRDGYVTHEAVMEGGVPREDRIAPRHKYHCSACDVGFDKPVFMKVEG